MHATEPGARTEWVDYGRGFCILLVVMMHATLGVEAAAGREGWLHAVVEFARPFRIPAFFLLSGLFVSRIIDRDWRTFLDRRVLHFAYFYFLWLTIQFAFKTPTLVADHGVAETMRLYLVALIDPFGSLWFIYLLPVFFVVARLLRRVPVLLVWLVAAALEAAPINTTWAVIDEFAARFVYFYSGYVMMPVIIRLAGSTGERARFASIGIALWGFLHAAIVAGGYADLPGVSLLLGYFGAAAIIAASAVLARYHLLPALQYCGQHSLAIYLSFFLPVAAARIALLRSGIVSDVGTISLVVTIAGVAGSVLLYLWLRGGRTSFLYERPDAFRLKPRFAFAPQR